MSLLMFTGAIIALLICYLAITFIVEEVDPKTGAAIAVFGTTLISLLAVALVAVVTAIISAVSFGAELWRYLN